MGDLAVVILWRKPRPSAVQWVAASLSQTVSVRVLEKTFEAGGEAYQVGRDVVERETRKQADPD